LPEARLPTYFFLIILVNTRHRGQLALKNGRTRGLRASGAARTSRAEGPSAITPTSCRQTGQQNSNLLMRTISEEQKGHLTMVFTSGS
jgi:hypothetical protein